jgi:hypothetical protein
VRDPADRARRRLLDRRWVGQPAGQIRLARAVPPLVVQLTQSAAGGSVAAPVDPTAQVRALAAPPWIGGRGEHHQVRAAGVDPTQVVPLA